MNFEEHHQAYCQETGLGLRYIPIEHDSDWYLWSKHYDLEDLKVVVCWLRQHYKDRPDILKNTLMFRHLIRCRDFFGEYLAQAQAEARVPKPTERDKVLELAGRPQSKPDNVQSARTALERTKLANDLAKWKKEFFGEP